MGKRTSRVAAAVLLAALVAFCEAAPVRAEGRTVVGTVTKIDPAAGRLTVRDENGVPWSYKLDPGTGIDLRSLRPGDTVRVQIGRATPPNMMSAADRIRRGDSVTRIRGD